SKEMAIRFKRKTTDNWKVEKLRLDIDSKIKRYNGKIMFPSTHDITPENALNCIKFIKKILEKGNSILIVSKPHFDIIKTLCNEVNEYKEKILFRFTIGSNNSDILKFWEPNAPKYEERFKTLKYAYDNGFKTSVSSEPMLDNIENTIKMTNELLPYINDSIWFGKPNFFLRRLKINGFKDELTLKRAEILLDNLNDENIMLFYNHFKTNPYIKWKDSIKNIVGIELPNVVGLDI
ncbi:MAG: hypothetical protein M0Q02_13070, partial [Candidatus Muirbacterium halophilum]|nr:hypothetical protein [Candidatus Muirbacterium halophilum]